jgi:hypothetical protein
MAKFVVGDKLVTVDIHGSSRLTDDKTMFKVTCEEESWNVPQDVLLDTYIPASEEAKHFYEASDSKQD